MFASESSTLNPMATQATGSGASTGTRTNLVQAVTDEGQRAGLTLRLRGVQEARVRKRGPGRIALRIGDDVAVEAEQHREIGVDASAVIAEHRHDRGTVAGRDRFAKRVVGGEQSRALREAQVLLVQRAAEQPLGSDELGADGRARRVLADRVHQHETADLHDHDQRDERGQDPRLKAQAHGAIRRLRAACRNGSPTRACAHA